MKKKLCLLALVLVSTFAATATAGSPSRLVPLSYCPGSWCNVDADCYAICPGGVGASYCNRLQHKCLPY